MQGLFCSTPGIKDRTFDSSWLSAKSTLISVSAVSQSAKRGARIQGKKNEVGCTGKVEISMVELLATGETCKAIF